MSVEDVRRMERKTNHHEFIGRVKCLDGYYHKVLKGCCSRCGGKIMVEGEV